MFQVYSTGIQLYTFFFKLFSIIACYKIWNIVLCAIYYVLVCLFGVVLGLSCFEGYYFSSSSGQVSHFMASLVAGAEALELQGFSSCGSDTKAQAQ